MSLQPEFTQHRPRRLGWGLEEIEEEGESGVFQTVSEVLTGGKMLPDLWGTRALVMGCGQVRSWEASLCLRLECDRPPRTAGMRKYK